MQQNTQLLRHTFATYSGRQMANLMMSLMGSIVDSIVISRFLGVDAIAAFQLVLPLTLVGAMLSQVFSTGIQTVCSRYLGSGHIDEAKSAYTMTILTIVPIALLWLLGIWLCADTIVALLGATGESAYLAEGAADYLYGAAPGFALMMFMPTQMNIMFLEGKSKYCMVSIACQLVINIAGDFYNAFFLHWGLFGMGLATSACNLVGFVVMLYGKLTAKGGIGFTSKGLKLRKVMAVVSIGVPSALSELYVSVQTFVVNRVLLIVATGTSVAAFGVINSLYDIFSPFLLGIATTTMTMAGVFYGERDKAGMHNLFNISLGSAVVVGLIIGVVGMLASPALVSLYFDSSDEAFDTAVRGFAIFVWLFPFYGINKILQDYYLGCNSIRMTYIINTLENLVFVVLAVVVLGHLYGEVGVWWGFVVGEVLAILATLVIIAIRKRRLPRTTDDMLFLSPLFDKMEETTREWTVGDDLQSVGGDLQSSPLEQVKKASSEARQYMLSLGASEADVWLVTETMNEFGELITSLGFKHGKHHYIDIRLVGYPRSILHDEIEQFKKIDQSSTREVEQIEKQFIEKQANLQSQHSTPNAQHKMDGWVFRLRDNCRQFDIDKWAAVHNDEDVKQHYPAIGALANRADEISYGYTMGMNYLLAKI